MRPTLDDLWHELRRGRVYECTLRHKDEHVEGLQSGRDVFIDPRPAVLEVLFHELLHRHRPDLGERAVLRESRRLFLTLTEAEKARWWAAYQRIKRTRRPLNTEST